MLPQEIIRKKRDHFPLTNDEISFFIQGITTNTIADSQIGAITMAILLNGMNKDEIISLTRNMRDSGDTLKWKSLNGPVVDKHSTGGVGDKISLMLAPMLASCGAYVPMISGRGLGHTGGTLDKFDSIPGYQTCPDNNLFVKTVKKIGCAIIGQTGNLAPADKRIYSIRDVCGTIESIPLITASILSKKLAAGLDYLIMDLKCGNGAFMNNLNDARALAHSIVDVATAFGTGTRAVLTDMNQILGTTVGNAVEMQEAVDYLKNINVDSRLHEITMTLCAELLVQSKLFKSLTTAKAQLQKNIDSGLALEIFARMVSSLGGPKDFVEKPEKYLPHSRLKLPVFALRPGYVSAMNTRNIGLALIELKGGRTRPDQKINHSTGFSGFCQIGDYVDQQTPLAFVHATTESNYNKIADILHANITISEKKPITPKNIFEVIK